MANPVTVTLSSVGVSRAVNLDWMAGGVTSFSVTGSSSGSFSVLVEATLDDLQLSSSPVWTTESSAGFVANSSIVAVSKPIGGLRMNSTTLSGAVLTMKILQAFES
jgi:Tfp pilus tip-associated adhesin PilY1